MYLLTETASPFALERWAAFFANFGQFDKGFFYTLGISIGALIVALLLGLIFGAMRETHDKVEEGSPSKGRHIVSGIISPSLSSEHDIRPRNDSNC